MYINQASVFKHHLPQRRVMRDVVAKPLKIHQIVGVVKHRLAYRILSVERFSNDQLLMNTLRIYM